MKSLVIGLGTLMLLALTRPALAQGCLSFRPPAFFAGASVAPGYPYPAYGYPVYPYPLPPAPSLGFGRGGIYGHVFVGRDESIKSYTFPAATAGNSGGAAPAPTEGPLLVTSTRGPARHFQGLALSPR